MHQRKKRTNEKGFTLVEMSIVLVIIGLIVGGVLVGQDLIAAAKNRATIAQIQQFDVAVNTFVLRFTQAPGDLDKADDFLGAANVGNANGRIEAASVTGGNPTAFNGEIANFWNHLGLSGMVGATYEVAGANLTQDNTPITEVGRGIVAGFYTQGRSGHHWYIGGGTGTGAGSAGGIPSNFFGTTNGVTPSEAFAIDGKLDDGSGQTGIVRAISPAAPFAPATAPPDDECVTNADKDIYSLNTANPDCNLVINMSGI